MLERVPSSPEPSEALNLPTSATGPVYRGVALSTYLRELHKATTPTLLRAIGSFGKDAAPAAPDLAKALSDKDPAIRSSPALTAIQESRQVVWTRRKHWKYVVPPAFGSIHKNTTGDKSDERALALF